MASKQTHEFKTIGSLCLNVDIYTCSSSPTYDPKQPVVLFLHGGGFVAFDRACVPPHIVQSCLSRNWPLVSADYRKLPQTSGKDAFEDVKDAYLFVVEKLPELMGSGKGARCERVVVVGQSAGAYFSLLCGHYMAPAPIAILGYHSIPSISTPLFNTSKILGPPGTPAMLQSQIQLFLDEDVTVGSTPASRAFDPSCLSQDLSQNSEFEKPSADDGHPERLALVRWLLQTNAFPKLLEEGDKGLDDEGWKSFPGTVLLHGDADVVVPFELSEMLVRVIGPTPAKLFRAKGQNHGFDAPLFLGDPALTAVEEAWAALDEIVKSRI